MTAEERFQAAKHKARCGACGQEQNGPSERLALSGMLCGIPVILHVCSTCATKSKHPAMPGGREASKKR